MTTASIFQRFFVDLIPFVCFLFVFLFGFLFVCLLVYVYSSGSAGPRKV